MALRAPWLAAWAVLAGSLTGSSPHRDPSRLRPGLLLYAAPGEEEPNFSQTVVLLVEHGEEGSMGLVLNRPTDVLLREVLPKVKELASSDLELSWGGPVGPEHVFALVRSSRETATARTVFPGVLITGALDDVRKASSGRSPAGRLRVFSGYAGWGRGQLAAEVRHGFWVMDRADASVVFPPDPTKLWPRVHAILGRTEARLDPDATRAPILVPPPGRGRSEPNTPTSGRGGS
jgi:putative transcriptional regulator